MISIFFNLSFILSANLLLFCRLTTLFSINFLYLTLLNVSAIGAILVASVEAVILASIEFLSMLFYLCNLFLNFSPFELFITLIFSKNLLYISLTTFPESPNAKWITLKMSKRMYNMKQSYWILSYWKDTESYDES